MDSEGRNPGAIGYQPRAGGVTIDPRLAFVCVNLLGFTAVSPPVSTGMIVPAIGSYAARKAIAVFTTMTRNCCGWIPALVSRPKLKGGWGLLLRSTKLASGSLEFPIWRTAVVP